jgi:predicted permease
MEIMQILFKQIFLMFIYMMIGFTLYKKKMITKQGSKELATLLLYVILPMAIIKPFMIEFDYDKLVGLGKSFVIAVVALALSMLVAKLIFGKKHPMENFCAAFSNAGFIGIPLTQMALGEEAVFYIAIFVALLTVLQWTYGVMIISEENCDKSDRYCGCYRNYPVFNSGAGSTNRNDSSQLNCSAERAGCHDRTWCISGTDKTDRAFYHKNRICGNGCSSGSNPDADDCGIIAVPVQFSGCTSGNSDLCIRTDWNQCGDFCTVKWYGLHRSSEEYLL